MQNIFASKELEAKELRRVKNEARPRPGWALTYLTRRDNFVDLLRGRFHPRESSQGWAAELLRRGSGFISRSGSTEAFFQRPMKSSCSADWTRKSAAESYGG
jgi:hypothetical protein